MFPWISSNSCLQTFLLVRSDRAKIIIVKRFKYNVARVRVELRSYDQGRRINDAIICLS